MEAGTGSLIISIDSITPYALFAQTLLLFAVTAVGSYSLYVNYTADRSPQIYVISVVAALYVAAGGLWATVHAGPNPHLLEWLIWGLIGLGVSVGYVVINYGARPPSARSGTQILCWILFGGTVGVLLYIGRENGALAAPDPNFVAVIGIGALVGIGELVSRYRDEPTKALLTVPAIVYVALNASAAAIALGLAGRSLGGLGVGADSNTDALGVAWGPVLTCGLGAMAILRSALFVVRTDGKDLQVGPGSMVQTLLDAADQALDRLRAQERAWTVARLMERLATHPKNEPRTGIRARLGGPQVRVALDRDAFAFLVVEVIATLPSYCIALTQNMSPADQTAFTDAVSKVSAEDGLSDQIRLFTVGLIAMRSVGPEVLDAAISSLADDLQDRAIARAKVESKANGVEESSSLSEEHAREVALAMRTASEAAAREAVTPALQTLTAQAVDLAEQASEAASDTRQASSELVEQLGASASPTHAINAPALGPVVPPSGREARPTTNQTPPTQNCAASSAAATADSKPEAGATGAPAG